MCLQVAICIGHRCFNIGQIINIIGGDMIGNATSAKIRKQRFSYMPMGLFLRDYGIGKRGLLDCDAL